MALPKTSAGSKVHNGGMVIDPTPKIGHASMLNINQKYTPEELKTLMEAINIAPSWMSKRFIMQELLGWTEDTVAKNAQLKTEEDQKYTRGDKVGGYR